MGESPAGSWREDDDPTSPPTSSASQAGLSPPPVILLWVDIAGVWHSFGESLRWPQLSKLFSCPGHGPPRERERNRGWEQAAVSLCLRRTSHWLRTTTAPQSFAGNLGGFSLLEFSYFKSELKFTVTPSAGDISRFTHSQPWLTVVGDVITSREGPHPKQT